MLSFLESYPKTKDTDNEFHFDGTRELFFTLNLNYSVVNDHMSMTRVTS